MEGNKKLRNDIKKKIADPKNKVFVSVVTIWEIVIKKSSGKIKLSFDLEASIKKAGFEIIPILSAHALGIERLPLHHQDPFDRMLISQSQEENLTLISSDHQIWQYGGSILRAIL